MIKTIKQVDIKVNNEGYLTDFSQWNKEIGAEIVLFQFEELKKVV